MKVYDATETAYKNGYKNGYDDGYKKGYEDCKVEYKELENKVKETKKRAITIEKEKCND